MGLILKILRKFSCKSKCAFNQGDFSEDLRRVDLTKYELKVSDLMRLEKIIKKRPSVNMYLNEIRQTTEI
jgi:hypothetical protein